MIKLIKDLEVSIGFRKQEAEDCKVAIEYHKKMIERKKEELVETEKNLNVYQQAKEILKRELDSGEKK